MQPLIAAGIGKSPVQELREYFRPGLEIVVSSKHFLINDILICISHGLLKEMLDEVEDRENYILQKKVEYAPVMETPSEPAKCEIRMQ